MSADNANFKKRVAPPLARMSFVEAVTKYGDSWHLMMNVRMRAGDPMRHDTYDAFLMRQMEKGKLGRVQ